MIDAMNAMSQFFAEVIAFVMLAGVFAVGVFYALLAIVGNLLFYFQGNRS